MGTQPEAARPRRRFRRWLIGIGALLAVIGALAGIKVAQIRAMIAAGKAFKPPPESVSAAKATEQRWQRAREAVGTVLAINGVLLAAEYSGTVRQIAFVDGTVVSKGDVLVRLDTSTDEAQIAAARADAELARVNFDRQTILRSQGAAPQADLDTARAQYAKARAATANLEAIAAKKVIRAPFAGRVGIRDIELGQVVAAAAKIVSLQSVDPIYVEFTLPQQALSDLRPAQRVEVHVDAFPKRSWEGHLSIVNPEVNATTRNVRARAIVPNRDGLLTPGMFSRVRVLADQVDTVVAVPLTAIQFAPYGDSVFVLGAPDAGAADGGTADAGVAPPGLVATQRFVRLGERRGDFVAADEGLKPGETVVTTGAFKLRNGMPVVVNKELTPDAQLNPQPANR